MVDYSTLSDQALLILIARSHPDALAELYHRYNRLVFSLAFNIVGDRATAEEITLDVFTRIWTRANTYDSDRAAPNTWLTSITRYQAIDVLRRRKVRIERLTVSWSELLGEDPVADHDPEAAAELALQRARVRTAILELPPEQQEALALAYFRGFTHREIAEVLAQPLGTVKTRIRLAIKKLRHLLRHE